MPYRFFSSLGSVLLAVHFVTVGLVSFLSADEFILTELEKQALESSKGTPIRLAYSYDVVYVALPDGSHGGMLAPFLDLLEKRLGVKVELKKLDWESAFREIEEGKIDFYGPIGLSDKRRQSFITIDPIFRADGEIVTRVKEPLGSLANLTNKKIGLLTGSIIQRPIVAYLPPEGSVVYYPSMDAMMEGLVKGEIACFATVDDAELEIIHNPAIDYELLIPNFYTDQGFIGKGDRWKPIAAIINRFLKTHEGSRLATAVKEAKKTELIRAQQTWLAEDIAALRKKFSVVNVFDSGAMYPLSFDENDRRNGMLTEIHQIFHELTGVPLEVLNVDYSEGKYPTATELIRNDRCQLVSSQYSTVENWTSEDLSYSAPVWRDTIRSYSYGPPGNDDLRKMRVGTTPNGIEFFNWDLMIGKSPEVYKSRPHLLQALKEREIDVAFLSEMSFNYHYSILKDYRLRAFGNTLAEASIRYLYSKENPELNRLMDEAIKLHHTIDPNSHVEWAHKAEKYNTDVIRLHDFQRKVFFGVTAIVSTLVAGILIVLYRFATYDKQVRALIRRQQNFDLAWGDLKKRWFVSKGDHPFFRRWGLHFSGPSCSMDELAGAFGWSLYDDYANDMKAMKEKGLDFIVADKKVISSVDGKEHYYRRFLHRLNDQRFMSCIQDVTDQHEAEIQERFLEELFGAMREGLVIYDKEMRILKHNEAMALLIPVLNPEESICYKRIHGRNEPCLNCPVARTLKDGGRHVQDFYYENTKRWIEISSYPIVDPKSGEVVRVLEFARDITEQRNWENTLLEREKYLTAILEASNDGIIAVSDVDGKSHVNTRFIEMFDGGDPETFRQSFTTEKILKLHEKVSAQWKEINDARLLAMETLQPQTGTLQLYDGRIYDWRIAPAKLGFAGRTGITRIWTYRDITDRFKAAEAIQKSELKFRTLFNASPSGLALFDAVFGPDGKPIDFQYVDVNPALEKINRMTKAELIGQTMLEFFAHVRITSGKLDGEPLLTACLLAMENEPGIYTSCFEKYGSYQQLTIFKTETNQLAIFVNDETDRVLDEHSLRTMQTVIDHISEPVVWVDTDGKISYINEAGSEFFGFDASVSPLGREIWQFDTSVSPENWKEFLARIDADETCRFETAIQRKDGAKFPAHVVADRIEIDGQRLIAACFRDMSEQVRRIEAEQTARAKSRFLDHMSHEIRTPLNGMIGMTNLLSGTPLTAKQRGYVDLARSSGQQLLSIVNGILDFSDINAGKMTLHPARFDFSGLIHSVIAETTERLDANDPDGQIEFHVEYSTVVPRYLVGDMERLEQIMLVLLDNAVKFTEHGTITLLVSDDGHESRNVGTPCILRVEVIDTGTGISDEKMKQLFESFTLGDASFSRKYGGTGLGLVVSKNLVELMGGTVYVESKVDTGKRDGGSRFWFVVPLPIDGTAFLDAKEWTAMRTVVPKPIEPPATQTPPNETEISKEEPIILVVEDNKVNRIVVGEILKNAGYRCEFAENGAIACDRVASQRFSLILMDCQMPIMDGFEATKKIRSMEAGTDEKKPGHTGRIPIVALTANALKGDEDACLQAGMDAFCGKPADATRLTAVIRHWLGVT